MILNVSHSVESLCTNGEFKILLNMAKVNTIFQYFVTTVQWIISAKILNCITFEHTTLRLLATKMYSHKGLIISETMDTNMTSLEK